MPGRGFINLLGPLFVRVFKPGASEVKSLMLRTVSDSSVRVTMVTPASGKKIRIIMALMYTQQVADTQFELYFGAGANATIDLNNIIAQMQLNLDDHPNFLASWPDGGGPVGIADEVLSIRTASNIATNGFYIVHWREE